MALIMEIMKTIAQPVEELARWLEETYQVETIATIDKWRNLTGMTINLDCAVGDCAVTSEEVQVQSSTKFSKKIPKTKEVCQHIFLSGQKAGEQCTTKPKNGATHCSAHKPKSSVKSVKSNAEKPSKKKEGKKVDAINSDFESENEKVEKRPKKTTKITKESSDLELSEPEAPVKPLLKKKIKGASKTTKQYNTDEEYLDGDLDLSD
jgi:hypothetical protein